MSNIAPTLRCADSVILLFMQSVTHMKWTFLFAVASDFDYYMLCMSRFDVGHLLFIDNYARKTTERGQKNRICVYMQTQSWIKFRLSTYRDMTAITEKWFTTECFKHILCEKNAVSLSIFDNYLHKRGSTNRMVRLWT